MHVAWPAEMVSSRAAELRSVCCREMCSQGCRGARQHGEGVSRCAPRAAEVCSMPFEVLRSIPTEALCSIPAEAKGRVELPVPSWASQRAPRQVVLLSAKACHRGLCSVRPDMPSYLVRLRTHLGLVCMSSMLVKPSMQLTPNTANRAAKSTFQTLTHKSHMQLNSNDVRASGVKTDFKINESWSLAFYSPVLLGSGVGKTD